MVVVGWAIDYLVSQASAAAQKQLAEYSAVTSGGLQFGSPELTGFYQTVDPPTMAWKCLRFSRKMQADKAAGSIVAMEAIFKVEVASSQDLLLLTPLRLYFDRPVALAGTGNDSKFGVSLGATFDALWQMAPTGEGKSARIWSSTILSQKIDGMTWKDDSPGTTRQRFYYYNVTGQRQPGDRSDATNKPVQVPLVPWSGESEGALRKWGAGCDFRGGWRSARHIAIRSRAAEGSRQGDRRLPEGCREKGDVRRQLDQLGGEPVIQALIG